MSVNIIWMTLVGVVIGLITSMFVRGGRLTGMVQTVALGIIGYGVCGYFAERRGFSVLSQWLVGIVVTLLLITSYVLVANALSARKAKRSASPEAAEGGRSSSAV